MDDQIGMVTLNLIGKHQIILHGKEEYVRDDATHINGIEGFWSYARHGYITTEVYRNHTLNFI